MPGLATIDKSSQQSCEATGHPEDNCTEPVPGQIQKTSDHSVTVTNASGETKQIATLDSANMFFESHSHDYSLLEGCHQDESHTLDPDSGKLASITINGSPAYVVEDNVTSDPTTGEPVNIVGAGVNNSMTNNG
jgi:hypothetical protein